MPRRLHLANRIGLPVAALIFAAVGVGVLLGAQRFIADANQVAHTNEVIASIDAVEARLRDAEAAQRGYLLKDAPAERLAEALRKVRHGGRAIDPELAVEAWGEADPLNERERQVLRLAGEGRSSAEIAAQLNLSQGTVRNYLSEAIGKLGVGNRIEAYRLAREKGWL